ncbi:hypothetical protein P8625_12835 [Tenacibaculum tangerinum]|uniref:Lipoprotein n=1 Tax=Tenacibaculum tangerinum TaxID=3038772 RepID=A0ABY8L426_9FLAO|nr:hypothetical protein [Tenacibaculum tangerinum]WGH74953.1 hypothetical protein P8625_12835 [Tenacibaculum tangerinum]
MKRLLYLLTILCITVFINSCSNNDDILEKDDNLIAENACKDCETYAESKNNGGGVCLSGEREVVKGVSYQYVFTIGKSNLPVNINEVVDWEITSGEMEILNIVTILRENYTISYCIVKIGQGFTKGSIKAKSDLHNVGTIDRISHVQMSIDSKK